MSEVIESVKPQENAFSHLKTKSTWIQGNPFVVTADQMKMRWGFRGDKRLRCSLCGYFAKEGDTFRWQFTNDTSGAGGNPMLCAQCDGPKEKIVEIMKSRRHDMNTTHHFFK